MRTICLYFEIHQIIHLKRYRFFDIGNDHYYYDDYANEALPGAAKAVDEWLHTHPAKLRVEHSLAIIRPY